MATQTNEITQRLKSVGTPLPPPDEIRSEWLPERLEMTMAGTQLPLLSGPASEQGNGQTAVGQHWVFRPPFGVTHLKGKRTLSPWEALENPIKS